MAIGFSQGCHKCGGYPGHKSKNRAYLVECTQCGTFTCNEHISPMGGCPKCKSSKVRKVMTQRDVKKHKKGGNVEKGGQSGQAGKSGTQGGFDGDDDFGNGGEGQQQGTFARGGSDLPKQDNSGPTVNRSQDGGVPDSVRHNASRIHETLSGEGETASPAGLTEIPTSEGPVSERISERIVEKSDAENITHESSGDDNSIENAFHTHIEATKEISGDDRTPVNVRQYADLDDLFDDLPQTGKPANKKSAEEEEEEKPEADEDGFEKDSEEHDELSEEEESSEEDNEDAQQPAQEDESLSEEEKEAIDAEFKEIAKARADNLDNLTDIKYMVTLAGTERKKITPTHHLADAFWALSKKGADTRTEAQAYFDEIQSLRAEARKNRENPDVYMSMLTLEPDGRHAKANKKNLQALDELDGLYYSIGFGPRMAKQISPERADLIIKTLFNAGKKAFAVGLIGLDKHYAPYTIDAQKALFSQQLSNALEARLPVYITARKAEEDLAEVLKENGLRPGYPVVLTDLIQSEEMLNVVNEYDMHICLRPELTHESQNQALAYAKKVNPARWLLAAAYSHSTPKGHETDWNKPSYLPETAAKLAELFGRTDENLRTLCIGNMARLFFSKPWRTEKEEKEDLWAEFR